MVKHNRRAKIESLRYTTEAAESEPPFTTATDDHVDIVDSVINEGGGDVNEAFEVMAGELNSEDIQHITADQQELEELVEMMEAEEERRAEWKRGMLVRSREAEELHELVLDPALQEIDTVAHEEEKRQDLIVERDGNVLIQPKAKIKIKTVVFPPYDVDGFAACRNTSEKIRFLNTQQGWTRSLIAQYLGKLYQHVRNVLIQPVKKR